MIINNSSSDGILMVRTESDQIAAPCASCNASGIIISIRVGPWASGLEDPRVGRRLAGVGAAKAPGAAIPRGVEGRAGALAGHHAPVVMRPHLQPHRANGVQFKLTGAPEGSNGDGEIIAVDEADVIEILVISESDLGESGRRGAANAIAEEGAAAVPGGAAAASGGVEGAAVAAPHAAGPPRREAESIRLVRRQLEASPGQHRLPGPRNREEGDVPETKKKKMAERKRRDLNIASMIDVLRAWASSSSRKVYSVTLLETLMGMGFL
nr:hypothetical protein CR513_13447 [Ipomoea batatas]